MTLSDRQVGRPLKCPQVPFLLLDAQTTLSSFFRGVCRRRRLDLSLNVVPFMCTVHPDSSCMMCALFERQTVATKHKATAFMVISHLLFQRVNKL